MTYPSSFDSFTDVKKNGDVISESIVVPASTTPTTITTTYAIASGVTITGYTEVTTTPATNQFLVYYGTNTIQVGPTPASTTLSVTFTTRGTALTDLPMQALIDSVKAIEQALGLNPNGTYSSVANRFTAVESGMSHQHATEDLSTACDGTNVAFTLTHTPLLPDVMLLVLNSCILTYDVDYTVSGSDITFVNAPNSGNTLIAHYIY